MVLPNLASIVFAAHAEVVIQTIDLLRLFSRHAQIPGAALSPIDELLCTGVLEKEQGGAIGLPIENECNMRHIPLHRSGSNNS